MSEQPSSVPVLLVVNAGRRIGHDTPKDTKVVKLYSKPLRRLVRRHVFRKERRIERALQRCREDDRDVLELLDNASSYARRRAIAADRIERVEEARKKRLEVSK